MRNKKTRSCLRCKQNFEVLKSLNKNESLQDLLENKNLSHSTICDSCSEKLHLLKLTAQELRFPAENEQLIEGLHYYKEGTYWVFTELYHMLRGHCCKSGCRHCVYGYLKNTQPIAQN